MLPVIALVKESSLTLPDDSAQGGIVGGGGDGINSGVVSPDGVSGVAVWIGRGEGSGVDVTKMICWSSEVIPPGRFSGVR